MKNQIKVKNISKAVLFFGMYKKEEYTIITERKNSINF